MKIFDFKTSTVNRKKAEEKVRNSLQLKVYAWAYKQIHKTLPQSVGLFFINSKIKAEIKRQKFEPLPSKFACTYCAFRQTCPFAYR